MDIKMVCAANIKEMREQAGLTQKELGLLSGKARTFIADTEHGRRNLTLNNLAAVAKGLGVEPWMLLYPGENV